jgi:hypothetical protein
MQRAWRLTGKEREGVGAFSLIHGMRRRNEG